MNSIDGEIGPVRFLVPDTVILELDGLGTDSEKGPAALLALENSKKMPQIKIGGRNADTALVDYISKNGGMVATLDKNLKMNIKRCGGLIMSVSNNRIVVES